MNSLSKKISWVDYGVPFLGRDQIIDGLTHYVCGVLGNGKNNNAFILIRETIMSETLYATSKDYSKEYGEGLGQFDKIAFKDVQKRSNLKHKKIIKDCIGYDLDNFKYEDLRKNPLLSIIFIRLKYLLISDSIPLGLEDRYNYYKKWYNTKLGKATFKHWLETNGYKLQGYKNG